MRFQYVIAIRSDTPPRRGIDANERSIWEGILYTLIHIKMKKKIFSIEKGWGQDSTYFTLNQKAINTSVVDEIREEEKKIGKGYYNDLTIIVYCGYKNGEKIFETEAGSSLTITYSN